MKIIHIITSLTFAGAEKQVVSLATRMKKDGHELTIITLMETDGFQEVLRKNRIEFICLKLKNKYQFPLKIIKLRTLLNKLNPDVIHSHMAGIVIISRLFLSSYKWKLFETIHCTENELSLPHRLLLKLRVNKVNFTSVVSPKMKKVMTEHHYCSYNIAYIPNAVDDSFFINGKSSYQNVGNFKWVTVGRLARIKGYDHLIEACYLLKKSSIPFTLDIYGTGPEYEILRNKISHLGLAKVIKLKGINQNISSIISNYDGFISSSVLEAFGIVIIEALAAGLPVLTTDCEGPIQILGRTSEFGIVCNKESPYDLSDKMKIMMNMSIKDRVAIAISGRELVKRDYSLANISSQWLNIYNAY